MTDTVPSQEIIQKHTKKTKVSLVNVCRLYDKKSVSTCSVLFHDVVLAFFLMGFGKSILLPISTEKKERGTTCNIQPVKNHHQNFRAKNLFQFLGRNRPFFAWQTLVFGVSWEKSRNILQKSAQFSYKTFRSLGLLNERTLNSFPKILLLADMGINLGFLGFLLVLIPSEVWGVNMDRWIFRPPHALFAFPMATGDPGVFFGWYGGGG